MPGAGDVKDAFYRYGPMYGDELCSDGKTKWSNKTFCPLDKTSRYVTSDRVGYFGYKVRGVSYGGTLKLFGYKGTPLPKASLRHPLFNGFNGFFGNLGSHLQQDENEGSSGGADTRGPAARNRERRIPSRAAPDAAGCAWRQICLRRTVPTN